MKAGIASGVSGLSRYGDGVYAQRLKWDPIAKTSKAKYYYWVANKRIVPATANRKITAYDVKRMIEDPVGQGHKFVGLWLKIDLYYLIVNLIKW